MACSQGRNLVNAAGAWVDEVAAMAGVKTPIGIRPLSPVHGTHPGAGWAGCVWLAHGDERGRDLVFANPMQAH